jgi:ATP synthase protein I
MNNRAGPQRRLFAAGRESVSLSTVLVGFGIGYGLDRLLHTSPFLMIAFILLGLASGIVNLVRAARVLSSQ